MCDTTMWTAEYRAQSLAQGAALDNVEQTETTASSVAALSAGAEKEGFRTRFAYDARFARTPPMSPELVALLASRLSMGAPVSARALCEELLHRLTGVKGVRTEDAALLRMLASATTLADTRSPNSDDHRKRAMMLWDLVERYSTDGRNAVLHPPRPSRTPLASSSRRASRRSTWTHDRGDAGYLDEATQRLRAHFEKVFGSNTPPMGCPSASGSIELTPPQEVVNYLYDPATGPRTMRFLVAQRPGLGKTFCMVAAVASHWNAAKARPGGKPPFLILGDKNVQENFVKTCRAHKEHFKIEDMPLPDIADYKENHKDHVHMIDFRYRTNLQIVKNVASNPYALIIVDEAHLLVNLPADKQRSVNNSSNANMSGTSDEVVHVLQTQMHPSAALMLYPARCWKTSISCSSSSWAPRSRRARGKAR